MRDRCFKVWNKNYYNVQQVWQTLTINTEWDIAFVLVKFQNNHIKLNKDKYRLLFAG